MQVGAGVRTASIEIEMSMLPRGEVELIFAESGRFSRIFNNEVQTGMVIVLDYSTICHEMVLQALFAVDIRTE